MSQSQERSRLYWIDTVKALCMICVFLIHTEFYYNKFNITFSNILKPFYVNSFFFVSGYLFFKNNCISNISKRVIIKRLKAILYRLVIPMILFSSFFYVPKILFHNNNLNLNNTLLEIIGGLSYWFTAAITISQIMLLILIIAIRKINIIYYLIITAILFLIITTINNNQIRHDIFSYFPWFYKTGIAYTFIMTLGGVYFFKEKNINKFFNKKIILLFSLMYILIILYFNNNTTFLGLTGKVSFYGLFTIILGIIFSINLCKIIPHNFITDYIGRNSIVYYFLSGAIPALLGKIIKNYFDLNNYFITISITILSLLLATIISITINKYLPFLTDLRLLKKYSFEKTRIS